jgi:hypothetical protein
VESKGFELEVEGGSTGLRIRENCRGYTRFIFLGRIDSCWLLATVEELLSVEGSTVFWRRFGVGFPDIIPQRCSRHGRFFVVEEYGGGRWRGFILVLEGKHSKGWRAFASELRVVVNTQSIRCGGS